jgi:predicted enzyme related to lactoylglutathione lyase
LSIFGCDNQDDTTNNATCQNLWTCPDSDGMTTQDNLITNGPEMIIVTAPILVDGFVEYATHRTNEGIYTAVVSMEDVLEISQGMDDAEKLRNYLKELYDLGNLRFVLLGGDAQLVPFRRVANEFENALTGDYYTSNAPSLLYYSNLEVDFDKDGDGILGERRHDFFVEEARVSHVAVGRLPVETPAELSQFFKKYISYSTSEYQRFNYPLLFSDIAVDSDVTGVVDGAEGIEPTFQEFFPADFKENVKRLYATEDAAQKFGGQVISYTKLQMALMDGYSFLFHNGHGSHQYLATSIDIDVVEDFKNDLPFILLSCACLSANFADTDEGYSPQEPDDDSVAEILIYDYNGAVAYVGNTATGLGPWGGSQFLHAMTKAIFEDNVDSIGQAFNYGRATMATIDYTIPGLFSSLMEITEEREWWTQHVVTLFGDPSMRVVKESLQAVEIDAPESYGPGYQELTIYIKTTNGDPVNGATVVISKAEDFVIKVITDIEGKALFHFIPYQMRSITVGVSGRGILPTTRNISVQ